MSRRGAAMAGAGAVPDGAASFEEEEAPPTVGGLRRRLARRLAVAFGDDRAATPVLDARLIVGHVLGLDAGGLAREHDRPVPPAGLAAAIALAERRLKGEPVARLTGMREFWGLPFRLGPDTLVPRPETETVVIAALEALAGGGPLDRPLRLLDLGTGSGCILLALLSELPQAVGIGIDRAPGAAAMAQGNAKRLGFGGRALFACGDWSAAIGGRYDAIVANPPYIESSAIETLPPEVRDYDPVLALDGGFDGLEAFRRLIADLPALLAEGGAAVLELGAGQAEAVLAETARHGLSAVTRNDLGGIRRAVTVSAAGVAGSEKGLGKTSRSG